MKLAKALDGVILASTASAYQLDYLSMRRK